MQKKEIVSFNVVERDISALLELSDEELEVVTGGATNCPTDRACEPDCGTNCSNLASVTY